MNIRDANIEDLPVILSIFNDEIVHGTSNYSYDPMSEEEIQEWFEEKKAKGRPVIAAEENGKMLGFATYDPFRRKIGYQFTMEHSVYLIPEARGKGIGIGLMERLIELAREQNIHSMIGVVDASNRDSIGFHAKLGFEVVGEMREVGYKFNRWLDIVIMQRFL